MSLIGLWHPQVVALVSGNELLVANAGDSRCVCSRRGAAVALSTDHKPTDAAENERIRKARPRSVPQYTCGSLYGLRCSDRKARHADEQGGHPHGRFQQCLLVICCMCLSICLVQDKQLDCDVRNEQAGGYVAEGRVNGSLNLSRALGDMEYKQSAALGPEAQIVTAVPEARRSQPWHSIADW